MTISLLVPGARINGRGGRSAPAAPPVPVDRARSLARSQRRHRRGSAAVAAPRPQPPTPVQLTVVHTRAASWSITAIPEPLAQH